MGMDLEGKGGYFRWTTSAWCDVLALAEHYGWEPTATGPPLGVLKADHSGYYFGNDGARVYARDAKALADALERAVEEMPKRRPKAMSSVVDYKSIASPAVRESLTTFVDYCRKGSFRIY